MRTRGALQHTQTPALDHSAIKTKLTYLNKLVISHEVNLFLAGLSYLEPLCSGLSCMPPLEYIVVVCSTEFAYSVGVVDGRHTMVDIVKFGLVQNIFLPCVASRKSCFWYFNLLFSSFEHSSSRVHLLGQSSTERHTMEEMFPCLSVSKIITF